MEFDVLHFGHIKHFKSAKSLRFLLCITSDKFVNKGKDRPIFNSDIRAEVLESIQTIDAIYINKDKTPINFIKQIKPHIIFSGPDYKKMKMITQKILLKKKSSGEIRWKN